MARNGSHISLALMQSAARIMMSHSPSLWRDLDSYLSLAMRDVVKIFIHFLRYPWYFGCLKQNRISNIIISYKNVNTTGCNDICQQKWRRKTKHKRT